MPPQSVTFENLTEYRLAWAGEPEAHEWRTPLMALLRARAEASPSAPSEEIIAEVLIQLKEINSFSDEGTTSEESVRLATRLLRQETSDSIRYYAIRLLGDSIDQREVRQTIADYQRDPNLTIAYEVRLLLDEAPR